MMLTRLLNYSNASMSIIRLSYIQRNKKRAFLYIALICVFAWFTVYAGEILRTVFLSPESVRTWVLQYGARAPVALFVLQIAQVLIAPLNNFLINLVGGYLFGPYLGFTLNFFGWIVGAIVVFWFSRLFGRQFVDFFVKKETLDHYDDIISRSQYLVFLLFLLPGPPDDFLVYGVGLSRSVSFKTFLLMVTIGKIPGKLATSYLGAGVAEHSYFGAILYGAFIAVSIVVFILKPELWQVWKKKKDKQA